MRNSPTTEGANPIRPPVAGREWLARVFPVEKLSLTWAGQRAKCCSLIIQVLAEESSAIHGEEKRCAETKF
jgi:hypothetical protein